MYYSLSLLKAMAKQVKSTVNVEKSNSGNLFLWFAGFLIILLPLVRVSTAQDAALMPRLLVLAMFLFFFTGIILIRKKTVFSDFSNLRSAVFLLLALYLCVVILSSVLALNPQEGFFDIVRTVIFVVLVFYWVKLISLDKEWFGNLSKMVVVAASVSVVVGFYQYFSQVAGQPGGHLADGRALIYSVVGLMANKNLFSSYILMLFPFLIFGMAAFKGAWRIASITTFTLVSLLIVLLVTRAVWVGITVSFFTSTLLVLIFNEKLEIPPKLSVRLALFVSLAVLILVSLVFVGTRGSENPYLGKLSSIVRPDADNNHFRLNIWKITSEMTMDHPLTGVGAGNWQIAIPNYYSRIGLKGKEVNWQTPHNDFLWIASEKGIPGLLLFLGIIAMVSFYLIRIITGQSKRENKLQAILLYSGLVAYLTDSCFEFPYQRIDHQVYLSLFVAGIVAIYHQQHPLKALNIKRSIFVSAISALLIFCMVYSFSAVRMEMQVKKAISLISKGKQQEAIAGINSAENAFRNLDAMGSPLRYYSGLAYSNLNDHQEAIPNFLIALQQHPNHVALLSNTGLSYLKTGDTAQAIQYFNKALQIVPDYKEARVNLATIFYLEGDYTKSLEMLKAVKNKRKQPEIKQNIRALNKLLGIAEDSLVEAKKQLKIEKHKMHKKDKNKLKGIGLLPV